MVVFANGEPDKNQYRKFKIKVSSELGDTGMLKEVMERRLKHATRNTQHVANDIEQSSNQTIKQSVNSWANPDLIIIDGGKGQLNVVTKILKKNNLDVPVLAVSKGEGLRSALAPDKIFFPGEKKPLELPLASPALHIIKRVRDEAHRFAIKYHKDLRRRKMFGPRIGRGSKR
jgi:excinuclease ABC subunit C